MSRTVYLDLVGGAAGDMLLAALLDLGAPLDAVERALAAVGLDDVTLEVRECHPSGLRARRVDVLVGGVLADSTTVEGTPSIRTPDEAWSQHPSGAPHTHAHGRGHRPWRIIRDRIDRAALPARAKALALDAFARLAHAESRAHGVPLEAVEFHEVGSDDAIADIVGTAMAADALELSRVVVSPLPLGRGLVRGAHGPIPIPGPATLHILTGAPTVETTLESETVTPTGAALVMALADAFGPLPAMTLEAVGVGAGHKTWPDRPNVVRAILGQASAELAPPAEGDVVVEANLDDMSPEHLGPLFDALFAAGALDVWAQPAVFKKGRSGLVVSALGPSLEEPALARAFFRHSPTLGVRIRAVARRRLERRIERVDTPYGQVRVKLSSRPDAPDHAKPEHDDVLAAARAAGVPVRVVEEAALRATWTGRD
jgi:uncharacterized protein (TIGR00299 family) protein